MSDATILVPMDFSDCTAHVIQRALELARDIEADRVVLLHVMNTPEGVAVDTRLGNDRTAGDVLEQEARYKLRAHVAALEQAGLDVETRLDHGNPADTILAVSEQLQPSYIVMGTHGRAGLSRLLLGSVAEKVTRRATRPVITVRFQHRPECDASSCGWCATDVTAAQKQLAAESDG